MWRFVWTGDGGGILTLDHIPIARLAPEPPGHVIDTGHRIARLLNEDEANRKTP